VTLQHRTLMVGSARIAACSEWLAMQQTQSGREILALVARLHWCSPTGRPACALAYVSHRWRSAPQWLAWPRKSSQDARPVNGRECKDPARGACC